jgi:NAD(P)-dependent dehydrogenase (short-subunit alcohol dehydrogenase family)
MSGPRKTGIVTGASQGIGAGIVKEFIERGFSRQFAFSERHTSHGGPLGKIR